MKKFIKKQLVKIITKFIKINYIRRLILFVFRLYSQEITRSWEKTLVSFEDIVDNYGHAIRGLEKALHRHETTLSHLQEQLQQLVADNKRLKKQAPIVNNEVCSENISTLRGSSLTPHAALKVSLIINTYNRLHTLPNTLNSLNYLRYPHLEVIVIDGPSTDGTLDYLQTVWANKIKIYTCEANLAKSRNIGIMKASGDIICYIDDDAVPEADWIDELVSAYQDSKVAAVGGWTRDRTGVVYQAYSMAYNRNATYDSDISNPLQIQTYEANAEKFPGVIGVNSSFRRSALLEIGGFDEEYAYCAEDADVSLRLLDAGYEVRTVPTAEVHHCLASSPTRSQPDNFLSWSKIMTSIAYFCIKNATPAMSFRRCLEKIEERKADLRQNTRYRLAVNRINQADFDRLMTEIDQFSRKGIIDAFTFPNRQLIKDDIQPSPWQAFPRLRASPQRLRLAFISEEYSPDADVMSSMYPIAQGLAIAGHEVTVITQTETGQHTVSFESNLWVHRLPISTTMTASLPKDMPSLPNAFLQTAGLILDELDRINPRRQFHYIIGNNWNFSLAAIIASRKYPVVLDLYSQNSEGWKEKILDYPKYSTQINFTEALILEQAKHILVHSQTTCRDMKLNFNIGQDEKRITLLSTNCQFAVKELESILYELHTTQKELTSC